MSRQESFVERLEIVADVLRDGFHLRDLAVVLRESVELAERIGDLSGTEKRDLAISFVREVVRRTDGPGPDLLLDPILTALAPALIDLLVAASNGDLYLNKDKP